MLGQVTDPYSPIVFSHGNTIDVKSLYPSTPLDSYLVLSNPVEVLGTGGSLISSSGQAIDFLTPFTGTGTFTLNVGTNDFMIVGSNQPNPAPQTLTCGLTMESGEAVFGYGSTTINGPFMVTGDSEIEGTGGDVIFTNNSVAGTSAVTLSGGVLTFSGSGPDFDIESNLNCFLVLNNISGTQTFGGMISYDVYRIGEGGTTVFEGPLEENLAVEGGTVILSGADGAVTNQNNLDTALTLSGGTLVLDNTLANNTNRIKTTFFNFEGGNLELVGLNGGTTNQYLNFSPFVGPPAGPGFSEGSNVISVQAGAQASSSAMFTFAGPPASSDGSVDFQGLGTNAQVFFDSMPSGAIAPWATYAGTDFAAYDTTNGVVPLSAVGRPIQVASGTAGTYVLGDGPQTALGKNVFVSGVTMNTGEKLNLKGHTLTLGAWIQNGSPGTISKGSLAAASLLENGQYFQDIVFTTNADLTVDLTSALSSIGILKNGPETLTLSGAVFGTYGVNTLPLIYVNQGTLALDVTTPLSNAAEYNGYPTIVVGASAAGGNAVLSLKANNQFISSSETSSLVGVQILSGGQFDFNDYNATLQYLEIDGGTVNLGGGTLTTSSILANVIGSAGQMEKGTVSLTGSSPSISVASLFPDYSYEAASPGLTISSQITSSAPITKTGNGVLVLSNSSNSFGNGTVGLIVSAGAIVLENSGAAGSSNQQIQLGNSGLEADATGTLTLTNLITIGEANFSGSPLVLSGSVIQSAYGEVYVANSTTILNYVNNLPANQYASVEGKTGPGTLTMGGQASGTSTGIFSLDQGLLDFSSSTPLPAGMTLRITGGTMEAVSNPCVVNNPLTIVNDAAFEGAEPLTFAASIGNTLGTASNQTLYVNGTAPITINNLYAQSNLIKDGTGTLVLEGNPTLLSLQIDKGTLEIQNAPPSGASLQSTLIVKPGVLNFNNCNATPSSLSGNGTIQLGAGNLTTEGGTFSGVITGTGTVTQTGPDILTLSGANTYSGVTTVSGGILQIDSSNINSTTDVNGGILQGKGTFGSVILNSGAIAPGGIGTQGTLSASNLTWNPGSALNMDLGASGSSDLLKLSQNFIKGLSGPGSGYVFDFSALSGVTASGTYKIVTFNSTNFSASDFSTTGTISGVFTLSGNSLQFTVQ